MAYGGKNLHSQQYQGCLGGMTFVVVLADINGGLTALSNVGFGMFGVLGGGGKCK